MYSKFDAESMYNKFAAEYKAIKKPIISIETYVTEKLLSIDVPNETFIKLADKLDWYLLTRLRKFDIEELKIIELHIIWPAIIQSKLYTFEELELLNNENVKQFVHIPNAFNLMIYSLDKISFDNILKYSHSFNFNNASLYKKKMMNEEQINQIIFAGFAANIDWNALFYYQHKELSKEFKDKYLYRIKDNTFLVNKLAETNNV